MKISATSDVRLILHDTAQGWKIESGKDVKCTAVFWKTNGDHSDLTHPNCAREKDLNLEDNGNFGGDTNRGVQARCDPETRT